MKGDHGPHRPNEIVIDRDCGAFDNASRAPQLLYDSCILYCENNKSQRMSMMCYKDSYSATLGTLYRQCKLMSIMFRAGVKGGSE